MKRLPKDLIVSLTWTLAAICFTATFLWWITLP